MSTATPRCCGCCSMTGTKFGCGQALCGACTMHVDGAATRSCITTVDSIGESAITTIEAIGQAPQGAALQKAWLELGGADGDYCRPALYAAPRRHSRPSDHGRRARFPSLQRASSQRAASYAANLGLRKACRS